MCLDWWANVEGGNSYAIPTEGNITKVGMVEFTFELISSFLKDLEDWYREIKNKEGASKDVTKYMKMLEINGGLVDGKGLMESLRN